MGNEADDASFTFGNADRVMRDLANDVDLYRAAISFSLFHVGTGIKLDLWKGDIVNWSLDAGPEFKVTAADGLYELNLPYPTRKISRTCWKVFDSQACPYAGHGALDLVHFPDADASKCDKNYDTAERVPRARDEAVLRRDPGRTAGRPDQGQLDRRVGLRAVAAHQRLAGRGLDLRPGAAGGLHRHRHAGELQGRGGPGRERLLRGVGDRGRGTARGVHDPAHGGQGRRRQSGDVRRPHPRWPDAPRLPRQQLRPPHGPGRRSGRRHRLLLARPIRQPDGRRLPEGVLRQHRRSRTTSRRARRSS